MINIFLCVLLLGLAREGVQDPEIGLVHIPEVVHVLVNDDTVDQELAHAHVVKIEQGNLTGTREGIPKARIVAMAQKIVNMTQLLRIHQQIGQI